MAVALLLLLVALRPDPKELAARLARAAKATKAAIGSEEGSLASPDEGDAEPRGLKQVLQLLKPA